MNAVLFRCGPPAGGKGQHESAPGIEEVDGIPGGRAIARNLIPERKSRSSKIEEGRDYCEHHSVRILSRIYFFSDLLNLKPYKGKISNPRMGGKPITITSGVNIILVAVRMLSC